MATLVQPVGPVDVEKSREVRSWSGSRWRWLRSSLSQVHFYLTGVMALTLIPALKAARLPLQFDWTRLVQAWTGLMFHAIFLACVLYVIAGGYNATLCPVLLRYWKDKRRLILLVPLLAELLWLFTPAVAAVVTVAFLAIIELAERTRRKPGALPEAARAVVLPGAYLFLGLVMVFAYNDVIVSSRFFAAYDPVFNRADSWILHGATVSRIAHKVGAHLPMAAYRFLEFVYFGMFSQIGAGIILVALYLGMSKAFRLVGTLLTAYCFALLCFYFWPSHGPYYSCPIHFAAFPHQLTSYGAQQTLLARARALWEGRGIASIGTDYYIAFPCMHIAQPLIVMWFLRPWKRVLAVLAGVNAVLVSAILLLEWHYLVDILGGVAVAALAVLLVNWAAIRRAPASTLSP
ncbi:MAG TPA: phosphatase PAP2 family protein [Terriglobia bacterium]|nr:phosphatase PAP2 family protein [Terriglobia bacterium]